MPQYSQKEMVEFIKQVTLNASKGLTTNKIYHKQWYLERILFLCGIDLDALEGELREEGIKWERGSCSLINFFV